MKVKSMSLGPLGTNCYIIHNSNEAIIVDPGGEPEKVISYLDDEGLKPNAILLTHAHFDHIGGVDKLRTHFAVDVYIHEKEDEWLNDPALNGSLLFIGSEIATKNAEHYLVPGTVKLHTISFEVIHTPGHSPGSVSFIFHDEAFVIGGDVLFNRGIGRTDLPGGDIKELESSIRNGLYTLSDHFTVFPGHGPKTTIAEEKQHNPFFPY
ncbi:MBL fold metallo-hydrolase [Virgibacillus doumboii]|uniref:MBL fold metallo-hydrolase n=1 Tax=Virgibacillus doumboii TaxID=2697503 RepID=UPI0013E06B67|nr:MBL fold metallo-hydrolase [Virgibacillus doumboii]